MKKINSILTALVMSVFIQSSASATEIVVEYDLDRVGNTPSQTTDLSTVKIFDIRGLDPQISKMANQPSYTEEEHDIFMMKSSDYTDLFGSIIEEVKNSSYAQKAWDFLKYGASKAGNAAIMTKDGYFAFRNGVRSVKKTCYDDQHWLVKGAIRTGLASVGGAYLAPGMAELLGNTVFYGAQYVTGSVYIAKGVRHVYMWNYGLPHAIATARAVAVATPEIVSFAVEAPAKVGWTVAHPIEAAEMVLGTVVNSVKSAKNKVVSVASKVISIPGEMASAASKVASTVGSAYS